MRAITVFSIVLLAPASAYAQFAYVAPDGRTYAQLVAAHILPDHKVAPGRVNPAVTRKTKGTTICRTGWTATVRPPTRWTNTLKMALLPAGLQMADGELDHRLSIEDGGAPADATNLWFEVYADHYGARVKDVLETRLKTDVCKGKIGLDEARNALLGNWLTSYEKYVRPLPP